MTTMTFYYRKTDEKVDEIQKQLMALKNEFEVNLIEICLDDDPDLANQYDDRTPALQIGPYRLNYPFDETTIRIAIGATRDREMASGISPAEREKQLKHFVKISRLEKFSLWLSKNYVLFITAILVVFVGFPFLAPVLMYQGHTTGANIIYKVYSIFCHQLSFRSYFFYGEQPFYPRALANIPNVITYEAATGMSAFDTNFARAFLGNSLLGYKVAICERDVAIYGSLILAALIFQFTGKKIKALPWYWWVIIALIPIGIDGASQIPSLSIGWPTWLPIRESTPLLRTITGALFGLGTGWYVFPIMEESMIETRVSLARKLAIKKKFEQQKQVE
jgi:uncharacterized membrane protein